MPATAKKNPAENPKNTPAFVPPGAQSPPAGTVSVPAGDTEGAREGKVRDVSLMKSTVAATRINMPLYSAAANVNFTVTNKTIKTISAVKTVEGSVYNDLGSITADTYFTLKP